MKRKLKYEMKFTDSNLFELVDCFRWNRVSYGYNMRPRPFGRNVENVFECQKLCQSQAECKYFAYDTRRGRKWCWLKTGFGRLRRASRIMFGTKNCDGNSY